jgi:hypothetical protein
MRAVKYHLWTTVFYQKIYNNQHFKLQWFVVLNLRLRLTFKRPYWEECWCTTVPQAKQFVLGDYWAFLGWFCGARASHRPLIPWQKNWHNIGTNHITSRCSTFNAAILLWLLWAKTSQFYSKNHWEHHNVNDCYCRPNVFNSDGFTWVAV